MWILILKNSSKEEVNEVLTMAENYKQSGTDVLCRYCERRDANKDLAAARKTSRKFFNARLRNLGKHYNHFKY